MQNSVQKAISILKQGGIVIYPTDTAFGIGCRLDDEEAVDRLYEIRKRDKNKASPVLASSLHMLEPFLQTVPQRVIDQLIKSFWPGALTIVLKAKPEKIPANARGGTDTLGVRVPNHLTALEIIAGVGVPILGTSANFPGEKTPFHIRDLDPELVEQVDMVVEGECQLKKASTVIDCTELEWKILRQGAVDLRLQI
jgi:L-threonylcarbamoyladenylate synthase